MIRKGKAGGAGRIRTGDLRFRKPRLPSDTSSQPRERNSFLHFSETAGLSLHPGGELTQLRHSGPLWASSGRANLLKRWLGRQDSNLDLSD